MKIFAVKDEEDFSRKALAYLLYYERPKQFYIELPYDAELLSSHGVFALFSKAVYATITDGNTCVLFHGIPSAA